MCVYGTSSLSFMNYKYHLRFLGSTSSDRQDTQVPVACFTITASNSRWIIEQPQRHPI